MPFEILHFRGSDKIIKDKNLEKDVQATLEYVDDVLCGTIYRRGAFPRGIGGDAVARKRER